MKRIVVCIKPVPDPKEWHKLALDPMTKTLIRAGISSVINPLDKHALEVALALKDCTGAEVVLVSMAPPDAKTLLMEALAMGADRACLLSDRAFAGSDSLATARILAAAIRRIGAFDLVLCGNQTLDGSTAQIPSQVAEFLSVPNIMHVEEIQYDPAGSLRIVQTIERGRVHLESGFPLLLSVTKHINKPRFCSFLELLKAEKKELAVWTNADLALDPSLIGLAGSPTAMADLFIRQKRRSGTKLTGEPEEMVQGLLSALHRLGAV
ncbi:MAG: electron transfer flavoprotein subunit beta/FixA family protein [Deltaproteobacteria bacterium]|nr:electron transfer flavoprotein subunit beta/FixA family protein [Deltaproteobacteria bacterium]